MPVTTNESAPYAPSSAILNIIERCRSRGLPSPVTAEVLSRAQVPESLIPRTLQTLKVLDLLDDQGCPTPTLEGLRLAPESEYQQRMGDWLNNTYADILRYVDPATATETDLADAFRHYSPASMRDRMASLFIGLFSAAGLAPGRKTARGRQSRGAASVNGSANGGASKRATASAAPPPSRTPPNTPAPSPHSPSSPPPQTIVAANEYQLVALLDPAMKDDEQKAVWTLIQYLKTKGARTAA